MELKPDCSEISAIDKSVFERLS